MDQPGDADQRGAFDEAVEGTPLAKGNDRDEEAVVFAKTLREMTPHVFVTLVMVAVCSILFGAMAMSGVDLSSPTVPSLLALPHDDVLVRREAELRDRRVGVGHVDRWPDERAVGVEEAEVRANGTETGSPSG